MWMLQWHPVKYDILSNNFLWKYDERNYNEAYSNTYYKDNYDKLYLDSKYFYWKLENLNSTYELIYGNTLVYANNK